MGKTFSDTVDRVDSARCKNKREKIHSPSLPPSLLFTPRAYTAITLSVRSVLAFSHRDKFASRDQVHGNNYAAIR